MHFRRIYRYSLILFTFFTLSVSATDLSVGGTISSELFSAPETGFIAGMRYQVYIFSQKPINLRAIALYQNEEELREFKQPNWFSFTPSFDWVSILLRGNLYKNGPSCTAHIGNIIAEYSPYLLWLSDDLECDFRTPKPRGASIENLKVGNFEFSGLSIWDSLKDNDSLNTIGVRIRLNQSQETKKEFIYLNTGIRGPDQKRPQTVYSIDLRRKFGILDIGGIFASEETYKEKSQLINSNISIDVDKYCLSFFYRNHLQPFNPVYRLTRPEFDPKSGKYLGWNPIDKYSGLVGSQILFVDKETQGKNLYSSFEKYHNIKDDSYQNTISFKINIPVKSSNLHLRTRLISIAREIGLGIPDYLEENITEIAYEKLILGDSIFLLLSHKSILKEHIKETYQTWGLKGVTKARFFWEAGNRTLSNNKRWFYKIKYSSPSGINIQWNKATPEIKNISKYSYDDDYNLIEWDNLLKIWCNVDF